MSERRLSPIASVSVSTSFFAAGIDVVVAVGLVLPEVELSLLEMELESLSESWTASESKNSLRTSAGFSFALNAASSAFPDAMVSSPSDSLESHSL